MIKNWFKNHVNSQLQKIYRIHLTLFCNTSIQKCCKIYANWTPAVNYNTPYPVITQVHCCGFSCLPEFSDHHGVCICAWFSWTFLVDTRSTFIFNEPDLKYVIFHVGGPPVSHYLQYFLVVIVMWIHQWSSLFDSSDPLDMILILAARFSGKAVSSHQPPKVLMTKCMVHQFHSPTD